MTGTNANPFEGVNLFRGLNPFGTTNPFEAMQALTAMLGQGSQAFVQLQSGLMQHLAGGLAGNPAPVPGLMAEADRFREAFAAFQRSLSSALDLSGAVAKRLHEGGTTHPVGAEMLAKIFDPRGWMGGLAEAEGVLSGLAEGPQLADLWTVERKFARVFTAWAAMYRRSLDHNRVMLDAWTRAVGAFSAELNRRAEAGRTLESWREVAALWIETANDVLLEAQSSEGFLASQRELVKASTELRLAQQEAAEFCGELFGLPTRTELDDLHKTVTDLRREMRALQRERRAERSGMRAPRPRGEGAEPRAAAQEQGAGSGASDQGEASDG